VLATEGAATLELFDTAGRRVARRELRGLGLGRHSLMVEEAATFAPGVYLMRLVQGSRLAESKIALVR
jgi:hypothetical protein